MLNHRVVPRDTPLPCRSVGPATPSIRRRLAALLATALTAAGILAATPAPAAAVTSDDMSTLFLDRMNRDRVGRGLVAYVAWADLTALATERAGRMAAAHSLSHATAGGNVGDALDANGIAWQGYGEIIGMSGFAWGPDAVDNISTLWTNSPSHAGIMFSAGYNYVGIGAVRADDGTTWVSAVMTDSPDRTAPVARNVSIRVRTNRDVVFRWDGIDPLLQTRTAGIASYDVRVRRDNGSWWLIRNDTTARGLVLPRRAHRHWFSFRVQARDGRGNLSPWTSEIRIWVP